MKTEEIIQKLKDANVYAECPCGGEFKLSETMRLDNSFSESSGLWDGTNIIIKRDQLKNLKEYAGTLLHETAHALSGASDVSMEFEIELTRLLGVIISEGLKHGHK